MALRQRARYPESLALRARCLESVAQRKRARRTSILALRVRRLDASLACAQAPAGTRAPTCTYLLFRATSGTPWHDVGCSGYLRRNARERGPRREVRFARGNVWQKRHRPRCRPPRLSRPRLPRYPRDPHPWQRGPLRAHVASQPRLGVCGAGGGATPRERLLDIPSGGGHGRNIHLCAHDPRVLSLP